MNTRIRPSFTTWLRRYTTRALAETSQNLRPLQVVASKPLNDLAVNFHFTRKCNYSCKFCFHTSKTSSVLSQNKLLQVLSSVRDAGASKINFAGGEPFLPIYQERLGLMVRHAKEIGFSSVSIISNASFVRAEWFRDYGRSLDILGVSCDSDNDVEATNRAIGRAQSRADDQRIHVRRSAQLCREFGVKFKINTVVCAPNVGEDLSPFIRELNPMRWKIFQVLALKGENSGAGAIRDVQPMIISDEDFKWYIARNRAGLRQSLYNMEDIMKVEDNATMRNSYIIIDENGCLLDSSGGGKEPTSSILGTGGVEAAMNQLQSKPGGGFDQAGFISRGGYYPNQWQRDEPAPRRPMSATTNCG